LSSSSSGDRWQFQGSNGDSITIQLNSPDFDTYLELLDPGGYELSENDDFDGLNSQIGPIRLTETGRYTIIARSFAGVGSGDYTLRLNNSSSRVVATPFATPSQAQGSGLDYSLTPNYGSTSLTSGFLPDPFTVDLTSGGTVSVSYLGNNCTGYATRAPDYSVSYTSGAFSTLRFYFIGNGDTTMIINTPTASYTCIDDSFGTLNPTIDFNSPSSGRYDIWIGSYNSGVYVTGTLSVTEVTSNHP